MSITFTYIESSKIIMYMKTQNQLCVYLLFDYKMNLLF